MFNKSSQVLLTILLVWTAAFSPHTALSRQVSSKKTLYRSRDKVVVLNGTTITETVFNSDKAWLVQFYADWCRYSKDLVPAYKQLAEETYGWRNVVTVTALNCAHGNSTNVCNQFGVKGYPTLKLFPPGSTDGAYNNGTFINQGKDFDGEDETLAGLEQELIDLLEPQFPNVLSFTKHSGNGIGALSELWSSDETDVPRPAAIVMIFENTASYFGKELALRLSLKRRIKVFRFSGSNDISETYVIPSVSRMLSPAVLFLGQDEVPKRLAVNESDPVDSVYKTVLHLAGIQATAPSIWELARMERPDQPILPSENETFGSANHVIHVEYLLRQLHDTLYTEVLLSRNVSGPRLKALQDYLSLLIDSFPADETKIHDFFGALHPWILSKETLEVTELKEDLDRLEDHYKPWDGVDWSGWEHCEGSYAGHGVYTCGLWRLFHTLALTTMKVNGKDGATEAICGYAENFLACQECTRHFRAMVNSTVNGDNVLVEGSRAAGNFLLGRAHSPVNLTSTNGNLTLDAAFPPGNHTSRHQCPECFKKNGSHQLSTMEEVHLTPVMNTKEKSGGGEKVTEPLAARVLNEIKTLGRLVTRFFRL